MRRYLRIAAAVVGIALILALPRLVWWLKKPRRLSVVVVDKTVPFENWREHAAIPWILRALKIQSGAGAFLDPARDYIGFDPRTKTGRDLGPADLVGADVLVVADTYGVYRGDYERHNDEAALERSPKIYGGMSEAEARALADFAGRGGLVLAEFNTFASPTEPGPRAELEAVFGVRWQKWVARYWPDLQDEREVPRWVGRVYERVMRAPFDLTGPGLVFVREDRDIVVLRAGEDLGPLVVTQERTAAGATLDLPERGGFWFWMDVVEATDAEVLYEHVVDVTSTGADKLAHHGLLPRFPALTKRRDAWYFAGDLVDTALERGDPERAFLLPFKQWSVALSAGASGEERVFWGFYAPIVARLFNARAK